MPNSRNRRPTHPGAVLREDVLPALEKSQSEFAELLDVSRKTVNGILNERAPVTVDMAHRLARALGTTPEVWLGMQQAVDLYDALTANKEAYARIRKVERIAA